MTWKIAKLGNIIEFIQEQPPEQGKTNNDAVRPLVIESNGVISNNPFTGTSCDATIPATTPLPRDSPHKNKGSLNSQQAIFAVTMPS